MSNEEYLNKYPQHALQRQVYDEAAAALRFLTWLSDNEYYVCKQDAEWDDQYEPISISQKTLVAEFVGIDQQKLSEEKDQMLKEMQEEYDNSTSKDCRKDG